MRYATFSQVLLEVWNNEFGRLLNEAPSMLPSQELPVLSAHANEGPNGSTAQVGEEDGRVGWS